jgi:hypothetical protein
MKHYGSLWDEEKHFLLINISLENSKLAKPIKKDQGNTMKKRGGFLSKHKGE